MEKRYYYKKDGNPAYNIKQPLENILEDTSGYVEITKEEWDTLTAIPQPTEEEIQRREARKQIANARKFLADTDWIIVKIAEETDPDRISSLRSKYATIITQRQAARALINELEG